MNDNTEKIFIDFKSLGEKIKRQRLLLGLSQEKLSEQLGLSESFFSRIERGERFLSLDSLIKISNTLNLSLDYLLAESLNYITNEDIAIKEVGTMFQSMDSKQIQYILDLLRVVTANIDTLVNK